VTALRLRERSTATNSVSWIITGLGLEQRHAEVTVCRPALELHGVDDGDRARSHPPRDEHPRHGLNYRSDRRSQMRHSAFAGSSSKPASTERRSFGTLT